ncbi:hypothetical protein Dimus_009848 [Dionaea muscipula]
MRGQKERLVNLARVSGSGIVVGFERISNERDLKDEIELYEGIKREASSLGERDGFKGDQVSIIGGAIDFVKELEQLLKSLEAQKRMRQAKENNCGGDASTAPTAEHHVEPILVKY